MELKLSEFIIRQFINNGYEFFTGRQLAEEGKVAGVRLVSSERLNFAGKVKDGEKEYLADAPVRRRADAGTLRLCSFVL